MKSNRSPTVVIEELLTALRKIEAIAKNQRRLQINMNAIELIARKAGL
jgi:hypothetical protein